MIRAHGVRITVWLGLLAAASVHAQPLPEGAEDRVLDRFDDPAAWRAGASDQVQATLERAPRGGLCLRYDFGRVSGYAVLRRALPLALPAAPARYELRLTLQGEGPANALQFKLVDGSGDNVWWMNRPAYTPPATPSLLRLRRRDIEFAWGPTPDRTLRSAAAVELVVASGPGGQGRLCFSELVLRTLPPLGPLPAPRLQAEADAAQAAAALDGDRASAWQPARPAPGHTTLWQVDWGQPRELNGLRLRWADAARAAPDLDVELSDDGQQWRTAYRLRGSQRPVQPLWLPETETRHLRLRLLGPPTTTPRGARRMPPPPAAGRLALSELEVMTPLQWPRYTSLLQSLGEDTPRGRMPRGYVGEQGYWTLVGTDGGGAAAALMSEDGAVEPHKAGPSLEPYVVDEQGRPAGWADAAAVTHGLRDGYLPMPWTQWQGEGWTLKVEAAADARAAATAASQASAPHDGRLLLRYTLTNTGSQPRRLSLALALRPWQVNPPTQFLNTPGGAAPVQRIALSRQGAEVEGRPWLWLPQPAAQQAVLPFDAGDPVALLAAGRLPADDRVDDPQQHAGALWRWPLTLAPGASGQVVLAMPLADDRHRDAATRAPWPLASAEEAGARFEQVAEGWRRRLNAVQLSLPPNAPAYADTLRSALAHMLISRDGPALQPGTRSYARTWVRDGAMMVAALLRLGEVDAARDFVRWYAGYLFSNGKVPCCVDRRGADPVAENDSHGQFIHAVALLWRHTGDRAQLEALWPQVDAAARYMETLRQSERTPRNREPGREAFYGLMPASISHEGYSAQPMHSYWDDFWALAGYRDAAALAATLNLGPRAGELAAQRDEFRRELGESLQRAVAQHRIDFIPGAAELGDFDPTSTTMIFSPAGADDLVPRALLDSTWDRYARESEARAAGRKAWVDYTPYEWRSVSAHARLGRPDRAQALSDFLMADRRPLGWQQWAEVVGRLPREPRFLGDMPHAWISSDHVRSVLDLLAYERDRDDAMVLGAGVPEAWWRAGPVALDGLRTPWGPLSMRLALAADAPVLELQVDAGLRRPPGGLWFAWTTASPPPAQDAEGRPLAWQDGLLRLPDGDAVRLRLPVGAGAGAR